eukprot:CAMPEP_0179926824 /NCGR_PEP_ID=MMETSP0983-20121128/7987_1 /TAXON_ID=483367 /ORGANISM="non described non described, Strain CCMP 2436" /LENGTH=270 /DNA_ID=CAMNT_0021830481 /DNA_START=623 /DNA_END=1435 /DNA_ORIENTATION=+
MSTDTPLLAHLFTLVGLPMPVDGADLPTCTCPTCSYERGLLETGVTFLSAATETLDSLDTLREIFRVAKAAEEAKEQAAKEQEAKEQAAKEQDAKEQKAAAQAIDDCLDAELYELMPVLKDVVAINAPPSPPVQRRDREQQEHEEQQQEEQTDYMYDLLVQAEALGGSRAPPPGAQRDHHHAAHHPGQGGSKSTARAVSTGKLPRKSPRKTPAEEDADITLAIYKKQRRALARSPPPNPHLYNCDHCLACTNTELESDAHLALHLAAHHD